MKPEDFEKLAKSLFFSVPAFPVVLTRLISKPSSVHLKPPSIYHCPAYLFLLYSLILCYFVIRALACERIFKAPPMEWLVFSVVYTSLLVAVQQFLIRSIFKKETESKSVESTISLFVYIFSAILVVGALGSAAIEGAWGVQVKDPRVVGGLYFVLFYLLFINLKSYLGASNKKALGSALLAFLGVFLVGGISTGLLVMLGTKFQVPVGC